MRTLYAELAEFIHKNDSMFIKEDFGEKYDA
jgi:hypothetical protein